MNPLVSVVIPTYNHGHFLRRSLQSVLTQTYPKWEAIVVDNHSTDDTDAVLASMQDPRIRVLKIHNKGVIAASRNLGIRSASGEWVAFLDSDDFWFPTKLVTLVEAGAIDRDAEVVANDEVMVDIRSGVRRTLRHGPYEDDFYRALLTTGNRLSPSATMVRRDFLVRSGVMFDESPDFVAVEDYDFWLNLARAGARFRFVPEVLGEFVIHSSNSSSATMRQLTNGEAVLRRHVFTLQQFDLERDQLWADVVTRLHVGLVKHLVSTRQWIEAALLVARLLAMSPVRSIGYLSGRLAARLGRN